MANNSDLVGAYEEIHTKKPINLEDWEIAKRIIEVFGNRKFLPLLMEEKCMNAILEKIEYPDEKTKKKIIDDMLYFLSAA